MKGTVYLNGKKILIFFVAACVIFVLVELAVSKYGLSCTHFSFKNDRLTENIRIVQLTDLHNSEFGQGNERLVRLVDSQSPDLILITGDLLNSGEKDTNIAINIIQALCNIAPVYISNGNHEVEYKEKYGTDPDILYQDAGAVVLEKEWQDITVNEQRLRIGGIYGYCLPEKYAGEARPDETEFLQKFQDTDACRILMCHMPVCWIINESLEDWDVDFVFAGHVHGGEVILPFAGGMYAPDMGWFPGRLEGVWQSSDGQKSLILSRGLGTTEIIPRFNNIPEIVCVDIGP